MSLDGVRRCRPRRTPIGIKTALKLAGAAKAWVRVLTDPITGRVIDLGRERYRPSTDMRILLSVLDGGGRGPHCPRGPDETPTPVPEDLIDPDDRPF